MTKLHESQDWNREHIPDYFEVFIDAPLEQVVARDYKGLFEGARNSSLEDVVDVDLEFPRPKRPDLTIRNAAGVEALLSNADQLVERLVARASTSA